MDEQDFLGKRQQDFCKRTHLTNSLEFFEGIKEASGQGDPVDRVYLDFQKASDKVPYQRFLITLLCHGIRGKNSN